MASVTISRSEDRLIAVKQAPAERAGEIEREAEILGKLSHPGVVEVIDLHRGGDGAAALHLEFVGSDNWATRPLTDPVARAGAGAALAAVVADLHDIGVAHRNLDGSHVLHGGDDRPVLCSFGRSGDASPEHRREDLVALADLVWDEALAPGSVTGKLADLAASTRSGRLGARELARRLDRLVGAPDQKPKGNLKPKGTRPGPAIAAGPGPAQPRTGQGLGSDQRPDPGPRPRRRALTATAVGLAVMALVLTGLLGGSAGGHDRTDPAAAVSAAGDGRDQPPEPTNQLPGSADQPPGLGESSADVPAAETGETASETALTGRDKTASETALTGRDKTASETALTGRDKTAGETASAEPGRAAVDRSGSVATGEAATGVPDFAGMGGAATRAPGSADTSQFETEPGDSAEPAAGLIHDRDGRRYAIGAEGDLVVLGDWDCDGEATPAIARTSTGHVVLFDRWPPPGATISESDASARRVVDDLIGVELERADEPGGCDRLRVHTATRSHLLASDGGS